MKKINLNIFSKFAMMILLALIFTIPANAQKKTMTPDEALQKWLILGCSVGDDVSLEQIIADNADLLEDKIIAALNTEPDAKTYGKYKDKDDKDDFKLGYQSQALLALGFVYDKKKSKKSLTEPEKVSNDANHPLNASANHALHQN